MTHNQMGNIKIHSLSFKGRRENNEDSYLVLRLEPEIIFAAVADGMGGAVGGKTASEAVIKCCKKVIEDRFSKKVEVDLKQVLRKVFLESQRTIRESIKKEPLLKGMGTTLTCVLIQKNKFAWGNLGDSRIYHLSESKINLITKDHTHIQEFLENHEGIISNKILNSYGNLLTMSIDGGSDEPDIYPETEEYLNFNEGEYLLLCSDGLIINKTNNDSDIFKKIVKRTENIKAGTELLINTAYRAGSTDNITVILIENELVLKCKSISDNVINKK